MIDGIDDVSVSIESDIPFVLAAGNRVGATGCRWRREMPSGGKKIFNSVKVNKYRHVSTAVFLLRRSEQLKPPFLNLTCI